MVPQLAVSSPTLVPAHTPKLLDHILSLQPREVNGSSTAGQQRKVRVFVVCGGSKGSLSAMRMFEERLSHWEEDAMWVECSPTYGAFRLLSSLSVNSVLNVRLFGPF